MLLSSGCLDKDVAVRVRPKRIAPVRTNQVAKAVNFFQLICGDVDYWASAALSTIGCTVRGESKEYCGIGFGRGLGRYARSREARGGTFGGILDCGNF